MQQAWHIFKKDIRYLYREIAFLLALAVLFGLYERGARRDGDTSEAIQLLYAIVAAFTLARLVHAETIPGENQFWITRPYRWPSLLGAKLTFLIAFLHLPVLVMQMSLLLLDGFSIGTIAPGLLWTQVLIFLAITLPCFALASMTAGMVTFVAIILTLVAVGFIASESRIQRMFVFAPESIDWLRYSIPFVTAAIAFPPVLYLQYKDRRTPFSQMMSAAVAICGAIVFVSLPWTTLFSAQSLLSRQPGKIELTRGPDPSLDILPALSNQMSISLHLALTGVPEGVRPQVEMYEPELRVGTGSSVRLNPARLTLHRQAANPNELVLSGEIFPDRSFLAILRGETVTLHVAFFLTMFGNKRTMTIPFQKTPVAALDGLRCFDGDFDEVVCRSPFRWPANFVSVRYPWGNVTPFTHLISYSPFPANLQLDPVAERTGGAFWVKDRKSLRQVTIEIEEPLAYLRRDIEVSNFSLGAR